MGGKSPGNGHVYVAVGTSSVGTDSDYNVSAYAGVAAYTGTPWAAGAYGAGATGVEYEVGGYCMAEASTVGVDASCDVA